MKKALSIFLFTLLFTCGFAQHMQVKKPDFKYFPVAQKYVTPVLDKMSSDSAKLHPEYGILPFNAQCSECVELIDKRTVNSRFYTDPMVPGHTFSQKSYFPLHYKKNTHDIWRTIDPRLAPDVHHPGVYTAADQPVTAKCDLNKKLTSIKAGGFEFEFNRNLTTYFVDDSTVLTKAQQGNYSNYTIGQQGLEVTDMWPGIDMQQIFSTGEIKTNYIIKHQLNIPIDKGYMVIEDHISLPDGYTFEESDRGTHSGHHEFKGEYHLKNKNGRVLLKYQRPVYLDANSIGMHGIYLLKKDGNDYTLQTLIPVWWLSRTENVYPLTIDPVVAVDTPFVYGDSAMGNFISTGLPQASLGFTTVALGTCDYHMTVDVPGESQLLNTSIDIEYKLTYSDSCGSPPEPSPFCLFNQVRQYISCDGCPADQTVFFCRNIGDSTGYCTTDSNVNVGGNVRPHSYVVNYQQFLFCYPPQCPDYQLPFTMKNTDSICGDVCGYLCARGSKWGMTIEACQVSGYITQNKEVVCAGQSAIFTAVPDCGVPPYHYIWSADGGNTFDTIYGNTNFVVTTSDTISNYDSIQVICYIGDTCWNPQPYSTNNLLLNIIPAPRADAGPDVHLCEGGTATIGGNPTTDNGATTIWTGENATVQSWLSSTTIANPAISVPFGTIDTFFYALLTNDQTCPNTDTVYVFSSPADTVAIDSLGATRVCAGATVNLTALPGPYLTYLWNNGAAGPQVSVTAPGPYYVVVKDSLGCMDTSNIITVTNFGPPSVTIYPDTTILSGDSVDLTCNVNLFSSAIDSFFWYPAVNITCVNCANPVVAPLADQSYGLTIYSHGCQVNAAVLIQVIQPDNFFIPNVFTPNGDGNNDLFYIKYQSGVTVIQFQVFDRWGELVHDGLYPWDGRYKGKLQPPAVYVYVFKLQLYGRQQALMRKGSVTLLR